MTEEMKDHDILTTLVADVKNLKESQDFFHREMRQSLNELKNNYQAKLNDHETRIQNLETTRVDFREKLSNNTGYMKWVLIIMGLNFAVMVWHLTGYKI